MRTRMTSLAGFGAASTASSAVNTTLPTAAPGDAGRPLAMTLRCGAAVEGRVQQLVELVGLDAQDRLRLR